MKKLSVLLILILLLSSCNSKEKASVAKEYELNNKNSFVEVDAKEALAIFKDKGIIVFAFKECPYCQLLIPVVNDVAQDHKIDQIYYYNLKEDRLNNTKDYQALVEVTKDYIQLDESNQPKIMVPHLFIIKDGNIIEDHFGVLDNRVNDKEPLSKDEYRTLYDILNLKFKHYLEEEACPVEQDKNKGC
ncbi:MAG: hypothetical protein ACRCTA_01690 [Bacilli bacterium]